MSRRNFEAVVMDTVYAVILVEYVFVAHILIYIFFINIGCATLYHLSLMNVTVYNMSFNSNCRILAAELNYRFTKNPVRIWKIDIPHLIDLLISNNFSSMTFFCATRILRVIIRQSIVYNDSLQPLSAVTWEQLTDTCKLFALLSAYGTTVDWINGWTKQNVKKK